MSWKMVVTIHASKWYTIRSIPLYKRRFGRLDVHPSSVGHCTIDPPNGPQRYGESKHTPVGFFFMEAVIEM